MMRPTGACVDSSPSCVHTRQSMSAPQPSVHASSPHELSLSSSAMSVPLTPIFGELTSRKRRGLLAVHQMVADLDLHPGLFDNLPHRTQRGLQVALGA